MKPSRSFLPRIILAIAVLLAGHALLFYGSWTYTTGVLRQARLVGTFPSAEDGMRAILAKSYVHPRDIQIIRAGPNAGGGIQPHVWYVIACVWGGTRLDGSPVGWAGQDHEQPGSYFLATRDGWVLVREDYFPEVLGFWMKVYGLAGPGSAAPSHDWGSAPTHGCEF